MNFEFNRKVSSDAFSGSNEIDFGELYAKHLMLSIVRVKRCEISSAKN